MSIVDDGVAVGRRGWRQLTSMRTALMLLFLLAVAAIPGSLLPQRRLGVERVAAYLGQHRQLGPWLDRLSLFDVYASPWFSAIYLLLFVSLVGCLVPRLRTHGAALLRIPPDAPQRLDRLPAHADLPAADEPAPADLAAAGDAAAVTAQRLRGLLRRRRFRTAVRHHADGTVTVSAEKGYLKETGNLTFHLALLGLLVGVALGSWYGWHGNRVLVTGADRGFCDTLQQYDENALGAQVSGADLPAFCVSLDSFRATYQPSGEPLTFDAVLRYTERPGGPVQVRHASVNAPLRLRGANLYVLGHGYAPEVRYTDRYGKVTTTVTPFLPEDSMLTSTGVAVFPDANIDPATGRHDAAGQIGFAGVYLPTLPDDVAVNRSAYPAERNPRLMLVAYAGDLGLDSGTPLSVYTLDRRQLDAGRLKQVGEQHVLRPNDVWTLPDGSSVAFLGTQPWVSLSVRHDPGEPVMLAAAGLLILGLIASLTGKRRRIFFRVSPSGPAGPGGTSPSGTAGPGGTSPSGPAGPVAVSVGGLTRSDYPGFTEEFAEIVRAARLVPAGTGTDEDT